MFSKSSSFATLAILSLFLVLAECKKVDAQTTKVVGNPLDNNGASEFTLSWEAPRVETLSEGVSRTFIYFEGAAYNDPESGLPSYSTTRKLPLNAADVQVNIKNGVFEGLPASDEQVLRKEKAISSIIKVNSIISYYRKQPVAIIDFVPIRKNPQTGQYERLVSFDLEVTTTYKSGQNSNRRLRKKTTATSSVLSSGTWFKIGTTDNGIHKLTYGSLKNMGMDVASIDPTNLRVFGNGGAELPYDNSVYRHDDLKENAIHVEGEEDGSFDPGDYILFYGQSPHVWEKEGSAFEHKTNHFSDTTYYFVSADYFGGAPKRIALQESASSPSTVTVTTFNDYIVHEKDNINLIKSGIDWYGEAFGIKSSYDFSFSFPFIDASSPVSVESRYAGKSSIPISFTIQATNIGASDNIALTAVQSGYASTFASLGISEMTFNSSSSTININVTLNKSGNSSALGWLDYIQLNARRQLRMVGDQLLFRDVNSVSDGAIAKFQLSAASEDIRIWEITDPLNIKEQQITLAGNTLFYSLAADSLREFIAFNGNSFFTPTFSGKVANQNLHALPQTQMVVLTHPKFKAEADDIAEFHQTNDGLSVVVVTTEEVYNEFSSGSQDITAIKDFMRMFYDRAVDSTEMPLYLLLFGDGSYDYKDRINGNTNFIPSFQSKNSVSPTQSYITDDYFGLLDENESASTSDIIDIGIGRFPVRNRTEAQNAVKKVRAYARSSTLGAWRNNIVAVGDDEDRNIHMRDANNIATVVDTSYQEYNIDKIFFDAYQQVSGPGGERYPDVNEALTRRMNLGALVVYYIGHGGELGWAHERVLEVGQINSWTNINSMPLFVTATCEFSRYDDPQRTSAGEFVFLNPDGGGIGLLTTTRLVYSQPNKELAVAFSNNAFKPLNGEMPRLGDITRLTKVNGPKNINSRNFTLLGDPALRLSYPEYDVITTEMPDTISALEKVRVKGFVADKNGAKLTDFNGVVYPLIFDKSQSIQTLNNDGQGKFTFDLRKNVIFKGKASVKNGDFEFEFVVPKDIAYNFDSGRISYYTENGSKDGNGYYEGFIIGGEGNGVADTDGPDAELYLNDEQFVFGGLTDENPTLLAKVFDENGINTVGNGVGHDIVAILDENTTNTIVLNDYYESDLDSYQSGSIRYPFNELEEGKHQLRIRTWDVYNNSGEAYTEFVVANNANLALDHILNYPNPFTTNTAFYFAHNQPGQHLDVRIQVFSVSGRLIKTIDTYHQADGYQVGPIYWNGRDEFGDRIGRGVYVYKLKVTAPSGETVDKFEKLVILN